MNDAPWWRANPRQEFPGLSGIIRNRLAARGITTLDQLKNSSEEELRKECHLSNGFLLPTLSDDTIKKIKAWLCEHEMREEAK